MYVANCSKQFHIIAHSACMFSQFDMWYLCLAFGSVVSTWSFLHPRLERFVNEQKLLDMKRGIFTINPNKLTESAIFGNFTLKSRIHAGKYSAVFTTRESADYIIKYQVDCLGTLDSVHPIIRDTFFINMANDIGKAPRVRYISPPVILSQFRTSKFAFTMDDETWLNCVGIRGNVRFMVMDRVNGMSVSKYRKKYFPTGMPVHLAVYFLAKILEDLRRLHIYNIVHGDIHGGNVLIVFNSEGVASMQFIDFERAFFDERNRTNTPIHARGYWKHVLTTPWQIQGLPWGKRDDVYRAFDMFARMIFKDAWRDFIQDMANEVDPGALLYFRTREFLFDVPFGCCYDVSYPLAADRLGVGADVAKSIRNRFVRIMKTILKLDDVNTFPPYDLLLSELSEIYKELKR